MPSLPVRSTTRPFISYPAIGPFSAWTHTNLQFETLSIPLSERMPGARTRIPRGVTNRLCRG
jgi:hypothetical protein